MDWLWLMFGLVAGFAMLSMMGSERQRRVQDRLAAQAAEAPPPEAETPNAV
jgi:bacteriorhodopsin